MLILVLLFILLFRQVGSILNCPHDPSPPQPWRLQLLPSTSCGPPVSSHTGSE